MKKTCLYFAVVFFSFFFIVESCHRTADKSQEEGKKLVTQYCSSCHLPVYPDELDSISWVDHVLPAMASKLGITVRGRNSYHVEPFADISPEDWDKLVQYYKKLAPQKLKPAIPPVPLEMNTSIFKVKKPEWNDSSGVVTTSLVKLDTSQHTIFTGDAATNRLYSWNKNLQITNKKDVPSPPVDLNLQPDDEQLLTCIGSITHDLGYGEILKITTEDDKATKEVFARGLHRPVKAVPGDFNKDGLQDWIVCEFGYEKGGLTLFQQTADSGYKKKPIWRMPGAEEAIVKDFNGDGWPDIMALFAQGREGIWLFLNDQKGGFLAKKLLEFPPHYGSTSFQLADFNHDGEPDILYTCGDNADYSKILKPFHGMYIFLNKGDFQYEQAYFYPINGCTKAIAADFDQDGDLDIVTIAFFADLKNNPGESFIYFEQDTPLHFIPHSVPIHQYGRWISMDVGDYDGDGDPDIILGNYAKGYNFQQITPDWNKYLPFIVLENKTIGPGK